MLDTVELPTELKQASGRAVLLGQRAVHQLHAGRAFTDGGRDPLDAGRSHVAPANTRGVLVSNRWGCRASGQPAAPVWRQMGPV